MLSLSIVVVGVPFGVLVSRSLASTAVRFTHMDLLFGSVVLAALALAGTGATAFLRTPFLRLSSDLSYCLYLIHLSVGDAYQYLLHYFGYDAVASLGADWAWRIQGIAIVTISFGLAAVSKKYLEQPCLNLKQYYFR